MIVTFQIQIDPSSDRNFTKEELQIMYARMNEFCHSLELFRVYLRAEMYVNEKVYHEQC